MNTLPLQPQEAAQHNLTLILKALEEEFGLLSNLEVAEQAGHPGDENWAQEQYQAEKILRITQKGSPAYPGYQFHNGTLRPVVAELIVCGKQYNHSREGLVIWLISPTTYIPGHLRPVDIISQEEQLLTVAHKSLGVIW